MTQRTLVRVVSLCCFIALVQVPQNAEAQNRDSEAILPAGTLLRCTINEPNFSSKTAEVGDPVICNLSGVLLFDRLVFPRGAYLEGHLEAEKNPGHFVGKGYLRLVFDRIGTPDGQIPVPAKIVSAKGQKVNRQGDIVGHGHATRDAVEWMLPPLWPVKVLTLPAQGPYPTLKGEEPMTLRLMDDVAVPTQQADDGWQRRGKFSAESLPHPGDALPSRYIPALPRTPTPVKPTENAQSVQAATTVPTRAAPTPNAKQNTLILRNGATYSAAALSLADNRLSYTLPNGTTGAVGLDDVDWPKTFQANSENGSILTLNIQDTARPALP